MFSETDSNRFRHITKSDIENFFSSMIFKKVIIKYLDTSRPIFTILILHGLAVANKALSVYKNNLNRKLIFEGAIVHDIGSIYTYAPGIDCFGSLPYINHGIKGYELLIKEGFPLHADIAANHIGTGLLIKDIENNNLSLPIKNYSPTTIEQKIIAWSDKFFSKGSKDPADLLKEKKKKKILSSLKKHGQDKADTFIRWHKEITGKKI